MSKSKKSLIAGILILVGGLVTGVIVLIRLISVGYAQGTAVGSITDEDGTTMLLVSIEIEGVEYTLPVPENTWDGSAAYDKKDPSMYANVGKMKLQLFTLALPEMILGLTLILSNRKAFGEKKSKDSPDNNMTSQEDEQAKSDG